ncbi:MAG: flagellar biosynthesis protein FlhB [bacterium]|nr:flagellar biosynthesis protein FlhB [bacterium]
MDEDRTLPATGMRRGKERQKGNVPRSAEASTVLLLIVSLFLFPAIGGKLAGGITNITKYFFGSGMLLSINEKTTLSIIAFSIKNLLPFLIPFFAILIVVDIIGSIILGGWVYAPEALAVKWGAINPAQGFKNLFSPNAYFTLLKSLLKLTLIGTVIFVGIKGIIAPMLALTNSSAEAQSSFLVATIFKLLLNTILVFLVIAVSDYIFQKWTYEKSIRMTPQEVKEETRQTEGPPEIRSRIRAKQRELSRRRMMREVPKATVIITNPTELAIAIRYEQPKDSAPVVVAKGGGDIAKKIREIANKHNIPIVENKPLARLLFTTCDIDDQIPVKLYQAVAEIIAYVYKLKNVTSRYGGDKISAS